jgi:hypothetical protein
VPIVHDIDVVAVPVTVADASAAGQYDEPFVLTKSWV